MNVVQEVLGAQSFDHSRGAQVLTEPDEHEFNTWIHLCISRNSELKMKCIPGQKFKSGRHHFQST